LRVALEHSWQRVSIPDGTGLAAILPADNAVPHAMARLLEIK
jgi:hypothetical protein